jgi:hypothetical protein
MYFWEHLKQEGVTLSQMMTMIKMRGLVLVMEILMKKMRCFLTPEIHSRAWLQAAIILLQIVWHLSRVKLTWSSLALTTQEFSGGKPCQIPRKKKRV